MMNKKKINKYCIYFVLITGLTACIAMLFPQIRQMIIELTGHILHRKISLYQQWMKGLLSLAMGGIFFFILLSYCSLTASGKIFVHMVKTEIRDCFTEINWRSFTKPILLMFVVYSLGILSLIRADFLYLDDIGRSIVGNRGFFPFSRYVPEFLSIFIHANFQLMDISPLPQLIAIFILAVSSVLLVYVLNNRQITIIGLLASIPLGLSPYMLECLSYRYDAPYMALTVLVSIVPFLFIAYKKAFVFCSVILLLIMWMTYQAASGIYLLITLILCFNKWNSKQETNREIFLFLGRAFLSFCMAMLIFKLFLMRPFNTYVSNAVLPLSQIFSGTLTNFQTYVNTISNDFGLIWKTFIGIIICFFIAKSVYTSVQNRIYSFVASVILLCLLFILSFGAFIVLEHPLYAPRAMYGFGLLLSIISICLATKYNNNFAKIAVLALSWSFFVFAFSYGNALADQKRFANFRIGILMQDLSHLFPDKEDNKIIIQIKNSIGFSPVVRSMAIQYPIIYRLVPQMLMENDAWSNVYFLEYFNYSTTVLQMNMKEGEQFVDFNILDLPIVLKTYYHTIKSDGKRVLVELNKVIK